jgi:polysaccharide biosynthesis transport protein
MTDSSAASAGGFLEIARPVLRRWWLVVCIGAIVGGLSYVHFSGQPRTYTATTSVFIEASPVRSALGEAIPQGDPERRGRNEAALFRSRAVAAAAAEELGFEGDPDDLLGAVVASPVANSDFLAISATARDPAQAALTANAFARAYVEVRRTDASRDIRVAIASIQARLDALPAGLASRGERGQLNSRLERLRLALVLPAVEATQFEPAQAPSVPDGASPTRNAIFGGLVGLLFGIGAAYALGALERRIRWSGDVEGLYGYPLLAELPHARAMEREGLSAASDLTEGFRTLRTNLHLRDLVEGSGGRAIGTLLVTSAVGGEGKSTVVRNLAAAYRDAGARVVVVDADLRKPDLSSAGGDGLPRPGLADVLSGSAPIADAIERPPSDGLGQPMDGTDVFARYVSRGATAQANGNGSHPVPPPPPIAIVRAGRSPMDPAAVLSSPRVDQVLSELRDSFDIVIIDSSPLLPVSDALPLVSAVDGVVITTRVGVTTRRAAERLAQMISRVPGASVVGVVANDVRASEGLQTYGYTDSKRRGRRVSLRR